MKLKDKIAFCSGKDFWKTKAYPQYGIPSITMSDGSHGLRKQVNKVDFLGLNKSIPATCYPTLSALACSWDKDVLAEVAKAIGEEARANNVGILLGPGINIKRTPVCGRNFEYLSEDPILSGSLGIAYVQGLQSTRVGACVKHFACNNQEYNRFQSNSILDEKTLREIYLRPFEMVIKESSPYSVMCAYNKINGIHCSDNKYLLNDILREEWKYNGTVISDWCAMHNRIEGFKAGCDLNMPGGSAYMERDCYKAVKYGTLDEKYVDKSVDRIKNLVSKAIKGSYTFDEKKHNDIAQKAAEKSIVLLKNEDRILPIREGISITIIGGMARKIRHQGFGSSTVNASSLEHITDILSNVKYTCGYDEKGLTNEDMIAGAVKDAKNSDTAVIFAGLPDSYEAEGFDRKNIKMPEGHNRLIEAVAAVNPNTVVILMSGGALEIPWCNKVKGIIYASLPGQAGAQAIVNVLYGKVNPSGKLAETWPMEYTNTLSKDAVYSEGIYVGYRAYLKDKIPVRYSFGYGLSYTEFEYYDCSLEGRTLSVNVRNIGEFAGAETVQIYVENPCNKIKELKDYAKVFLKPGESSKVSFDLTDKCFVVWQKNWTIVKGEYKIYAGSSLDNIAFESSLYLDGEECIPIENVIIEHQEHKPCSGEYTMDNSIVEMMKDSFFLRVLYKSIIWYIKHKMMLVDETSPEYKMYIASALEGSLRNLQMSSGIKINIFGFLVKRANRRKKQFQKQTKKTNKENKIVL